jgi:hypothetical protein
LRPFDETYPFHDFFGIVPISSHWLFWLFEQTAPLIVADRLDITAIP